MSTAIQKAPPPVVERPKDSPWVAAIRDLNADILSLVQRARALTELPAGVSLDELQAAWKILCTGVSAGGMASASEVLSRLKKRWQDPGEWAATSFEDVLKQVNGQLAHAADPDLVGTSAFGKGLVIYNTSDGAFPPPTVMPPGVALGLVALGYADSLPPGHPLKLAMPKPRYWPGAASLSDDPRSGRKFAYVLGGLAGSQDHAQPPEVVSIRQVLHWTEWAANLKEEMRKQARLEAERVAAENKREEEKQLQAKRMAQLGGDKEVIRDMESKLHEQAAKIAALEALTKPKEAPAAPST
jgi:hypothetical protein